MHRVFILVVSCLLLGVLPASAQDAKDGKISALEKEVAFLHAELERLKAENQVMSERINGIKALLGVADVAAVTSLNSAASLERDLCYERLIGLRRKLDKLSNQGFTKEHPDMRNVATNEKIVAEECAALSEAISR